MADGNKTLSQQYYEAVEALKAGGTSNADAVRKVAADFGKEVNSVRGGIHQYKTKLSGGAASAAGRGRRRAAETVDDHMAIARSALEAALALIDSEVDQAKQALDAAQARYDEVSASVADRKAEVQKKLKALA